MKDNEQSNENDIISNQIQITVGENSVDESEVIKDNSLCTENMVDTVEKSVNLSESIFVHAQNNKDRSSPFQNQEIKSSKSDFRFKLKKYGQV